MKEHLLAPPQCWITRGHAVEGAAIGAVTIALWLRARRKGAANTLNAYRREALRTRTVLGKRRAYLKDTGSLPSNSFRLSATPPITVETTPKRLLDFDSWNWLWNWICQLAKSKQNVRIRWLLALPYHTGLCREEVAHGRMLNPLETLVSALRQRNTGSWQEHHWKQRKMSWGTPIQGPPD